ncbi:IPIL1 protein, partial [Baryphthengus martii]|nr:IPIL1 protein [Baryphthengus martii]
RFQWPGETLVHTSLLVKELVNDRLCVCQEHLSNTDHSLPLLQPAIGVGSTFEGWCPFREHEAIYSLLVPLKAPHGYAFHLELVTTEEMPAKDSRICVELQCTRTQEQMLDKNMLCFVHHREEEITSQRPSLLSTLCTGSYLDVQKIALCFQDLVRLTWAALPQWHHYRMNVLPSCRSCNLQLTKASGKPFYVKVMFGVQQGDSDIFLSSQTTDAIFFPSTMWPESYAVAQEKIFRQMARQAPHGSFHRECLHVCARFVLGTGFSISIMKAVVMHLLVTISLEKWHRRDFLQRLEDIMYYLHYCLEEQ